MTYRELKKCIKKMNKKQLDSEIEVIDSSVDEHFTVYAINFSNGKDKSEDNHLALIF